MSFPFYNERMETRNSHIIENGKKMEASVAYISFVRSLAKRILQLGNEENFIIFHSKLFPKYRRQQKQK